MKKNSLFYTFAAALIGVGIGFFFRYPSPKETIIPICLGIAFILFFLSLYDYMTKLCSKKKFYDILFIVLLMIFVIVITTLCLSNLFTVGIFFFSALLFIDPIIEIANSDAKMMQLYYSFPRIVLGFLGFFTCTPYYTVETNNVLSIFIFAGCVIYPIIYFVIKRRYR